MVYYKKVLWELTNYYHPHHHWSESILQSGICDAFTNAWAKLIVEDCALTATTVTAITTSSFENMKGFLLGASGL